MANKTQVLANMNNRQKITAGVLVLIVIIILYNIIGLFKSETPPAAPPAMAVNKTPTSAPQSMPAGAPGAPGAPAMNPPPPNTPQPAQVPKQAPMTEREMQLLQMQQELQVKYVAALNELQMLKVSRDIAETNKAIVTAKLETIASEKKIIDLLAPPPPVSTPTTPPTGAIITTTNETTSASNSLLAPPITYTVVSVSEIQGRWSAVMGSQGNLYNVRIGDIMPADGSKVIAIDKLGVILEKEGERKRISLIPAI